MGRSGTRDEGSFAGFGRQALPFLKALAFHQDKGWFEENRALWERDLKAPFGRLLADLTHRFADHGLPLRGDARSSLFRLHRDTRFGADKRPFKTNAGAVLSRDGTKRAQGFLYVHVDPAGCFAAAGFYRPEPDEIASIRRLIADRPQAYRDLVCLLEQDGLVLASPETLARLPRGFATIAEPDIAEAVRRKSHLVREPIPDEALGDPGLVKRLAAFARRAEPLLRFGWRALDEREPAAARGAERTGP